MDLDLKVSHLVPGKPFLLVEPSETCKTAQQLSEYIQTHRKKFLLRLVEDGAWLFRGFEGVTCETFNDIFRSFGLPPMLYVGGGSPGRDLVGGDAFSSTKWPPNASLWMHNELSYSTVTPTHVFFCSIKPAEELGYTPIADFREVLPRINPVFLEMLKKRQVVYRR
eukprot:TRINITY_DN3248_c0_g1_i3.p1 TRINITY_DN3248_c0_g1~~TRINITY_DN3248_c0_g1_i3.p1  ORF type:complete len:166 (+),score=26.48 TRINITY_DN3248_c0_g1_i3:719-1216(+)